MDGSTPLPVRKTWPVLLGLAGLLVLVFCASLLLGSARIPVAQILRILTGQPAANQNWSYIILNFRLVRSLTALLAGAALAWAGLQMQTLFRNPLADPFILGINSGASFGVALVVLGSGLSGATFLAGLGVLGDLSLAVAASLGAALALGIIMLVGRRVRSNTTLLILGLMFGYATSALVSLLIYFSAPERIQAYTLWSYGSFSGVTWSQMRVMLPVILMGLLVLLALPNVLNVLLLGEDYAKTMGLNANRARVFILLSASLLAGTVTAFCGPIGFLGVAVPHLARNLLHTADHKVLIPAVGLMGAIAAVLADIFAQLPGAQFVLPINVVTSLFGAPFVLWIILRQRKGGTTFSV
jgi:iron complex transport system permease protein